MRNRTWKFGSKQLSRVVLIGICLTILSLVPEPATASPMIKPSLPASAAAGGLPLIQIQEGGFLKRLFRGRRAKREPQRAQPKANRPRVKRSSKPRPPAQVIQSAPEIKQVDKNPDARRILVLGDFFGASLALGLAESFAQDRTVAIDSSTNGTSGFVRYDTFNWDAHLRTVLGDPELGGKADLIVVMMGGNDRQFFRSPQRISLDTNEWRQQYEANVDAFAERLEATELPVIWVGMPPVRGPKTSAHLANLTTTFKSEAEEIGARYVDIWDAFANEAGVYDDNGPDINGQQAQLRRSDGFGLSTAGREKLTFFVKRQVDRYLSGSGAVAGTPGGVVFTEDGPVIPLSGFALEDAISLKGGVPLIGPPMDPGKPWEEVSNAYNVLIRGVALNAPTTRADNFSWPPQIE